MTPPFLPETFKLEAARFQEFALKTGGDNDGSSKQKRESGRFARGQTGSVRCYLTIITEGA